MFCKSCGKQLAPNEVFCSNCGALVINDDDATDEVQQEPDQSAPAETEQAGVLPVRKGSTSEASDEASQVEEPSEPENRKKGILVPLLVGALCGLAILAAISFCTRPTTPASTSSETQTTPAGGEQDDESTQSATSVSEAPANSTQGTQSGADGTSASNSTSAQSSSSTTATSSDSSKTEPSQTAAPVFTSATASSQLPPDSYTNKYGPEYAIDGDVLTGWNEGNHDTNGQGEWIELQSSTPQVVQGIRIMGGYVKTEGKYNRNCRPTQVTITLSDGYTQQATLEDTYNYWNTVTFDKPHETTSIRITIDDVAQGTDYDDCVISEIEAF